MIHQLRQRTDAVEVWDHAALAARLELRERFGDVH
jgi:hypothetical protein